MQDDLSTFAGEISGQVTDRNEQRSYRVGPDEDVIPARGNLPNCGPRCGRIDVRAANVYAQRREVKGPLSEECRIGKRLCPGTDDESDQKNRAVSNENPNGEPLSFGRGLQEPHQRKDQ